MKFEQLYYKWDRSLEKGRFKLNDIIPDNQKKILRKEKDSEWYEILDNPYMKIKLDEKNSVREKLVLKGGEIGMWKIKFTFLEDMKKEVSALLIECQKSHTGDVLILKFGDFILGAAHLVRGV